MIFDKVTTSCNSDNSEGNWFLDFFQKMTLPHPLEKREILKFMGRYPYKLYGFFFQNVLKPNHPVVAMNHLGLGESLRMMTFMKLNQTRNKIELLTPTRQPGGEFY
jgi:hypothetical protein